jgi:hypothetical protein
MRPAALSQGDLLDNSKRETQRVVVGAAHVEAARPVDCSRSSGTLVVQRAAARTGTRSSASLIPRRAAVALLAGQAFLRVVSMGSQCPSAHPSRSRSATTWRPTGSAHRAETWTSQIGIDDLVAASSLLFIEIDWAGHSADPPSSPIGRRR